MYDEDFEPAVAELLLPTLRRLGFRRIEPPNSWMTPGLLFELENQWIGVSWDYRDLVLELDLGRLVTFPDVMPRVIVVGPRLANANRPHQETSAWVRLRLQDFSNELPAAVQSLEGALTALDARRNEAHKSGSVFKPRTLYELHASGTHLTVATWKGAVAIPLSAPDATN